MRQSDLEVRVWSTALRCGSLSMALTRTYGSASAQICAWNSWAIQDACTDAQVASESHLSWTLAVSPIYGVSSYVTGHDRTNHSGIGG